MRLCNFCIFALIYNRLGLHMYTAYRLKLDQVKLNASTPSADTTLIQPNATAIGRHSRCSRGRAQPCICTAATRAYCGTGTSSVQRC